MGVNQYDAGAPSTHDPIPDQVASELGQPSHDGSHQLAAGGAEIEAAACLSQDADLPAVRIIERLDEVLRAPSPLVELGDQDSVNLAGSRSAKTWARSGRAHCRHLTPSP